MPLLPAFLTRLIDKPCAIRMSGGQVSSCQRAYTRAPPLGLGDTRACFSHRIAKVAAHDPDIHSLRQRHAMLRPRTFVRGNEIIRTNRPSSLPEAIAAARWGGRACALGGQDSLPVVSRMHNDT